MCQLLRWLLTIVLRGVSPKHLKGKIERGEETEKNFSSPQ